MALMNDDDKPNVIIGKGILQYSFSLNILKYNVMDFSPFIDISLFGCHLFSLLL